MGEGEYEGAKTSVWWDIEHCQVPRGCDPYAIARNIAAALVAAGYVGTVSISSYGDTNRVPTNVQHALSSTGIALNHVPAGVKDASDKKILVDMLLWAVDNPPPANYLLISGDRDFSNALHQLRMRKYNILLAQPPYGSQEMIAAAKSVWSYTSLLAGGSPLPMSSHIGNLVSGNLLSAETCKIQDTVQTAQPDSSFHGTILGGHGNGRADSRYQRKQVPKYQNQSNTYVPRAPSNKFRQTQHENQGHASEILNNITSQRKHGILLPNHMSVSQVSTSEAQDNARSNYTNPSSSFAQTSSHKTVTEIGHFSRPEVKQFKEAPHKFLVAGKHTASSAPTPSNIPPHPDFPVSKGNPENHQTHNPQLLKSSDLQPRQPNYALGSSSAVDSYNHGSYPPTVRPDGLASTSCPSSGLPDMSKVSIADYNHNTSSLQLNQESNVNIVPQRNGAPHCMPSSYQDSVHSSPTFPSMDSNIPNSDQWGASRCPMPSSTVQTLMGEILRALHTLKLDKMAPTEENIADCIHYGEKLEDFNVRMALVYATEHRVVVMHKLGGNLPFYIGMSDTLWKCVNIMDVNARHPKAIWDAVLEFLSLDDGRSAMLASRCRYEAAMMLRNSCLTHMVLGDILQILYLMTHVKKWILPHSSGWQPLGFLLPVAA